MPGAPGISDAIVVGAGSAGLAASWHLTRRGIEHVVVERGRVGETWRTQRWDSFTLNTPAWMNHLPGVEAEPAPRDSFATGSAWVDHLEGYAAAAGLPVRTGVEVTGLAVRTDGTFEVRLAAGEVMHARSLIVASGFQHQPRIPAAASALPADVLQLHTAAYRGPADLPAGAVLVVGAAQSGGQVAEDLLAGGRTVLLVTSRVPRLRRRIRGRDAFEWLVAAGFFDTPTERVLDPAQRLIRQPLISGVGRYGHTLSLQWLASRGARLLGRLRTIEGGTLAFEDDVGANIRFGDEQSATANRMIADAIAARGLDEALPPLEDDPADEPHPAPDAVRGPAHLDLVDADIATVIWATGFRPLVEWLPGGLLDERGTPRHEGGVMPVPGLFVLGLPWLRSRGSGIVYGVDRDAALIVERIAAHLAR